MTGVRWDASEVGQDFPRDLRAAWAKLYPALVAEVGDAAKDIQTDWRDRAKASSGRHGKLYPGTIRAEKEGPLEAVIGPLSHLKQGGMGPGFEWGHPTVISSPNPEPGWFIGRDGNWKRGGFAGQRVGQDRPHLSMTHTMDEWDVKWPERVGRIVQRNFVL